MLLRGGEVEEVVEEFETGIRDGRDGLLLDLVSVATGIGILVLGARWFVGGAVTLAENAGISERVIGLTLVAFGTSLPELASTLAAARRAEGDILIGNLVGSNVFNVLFILGATGLVRPLAVARRTAELDLAVMIGGPPRGRKRGPVLPDRPRKRRDGIEAITSPPRLSSMDDTGGDFLTP